MNGVTFVLFEGWAFLREEGNGLPYTEYGSVTMLITTLCAGSE